jgi:hypothetical protein
MAERIDCRKAELMVSKGHDQCKWCGRAVAYHHKKGYVHRRGYRRLWPDPRKAEPAPRPTEDEFNAKHGLGRGGM